jgi:hypothetical protein
MYMEFCGFLVILIVLLINVLIINYVRKLEQVSCECSENWKRDYIKYYSLVTVILTSVICLIPLFLQLTNIKYDVQSVLSNPFVSVISYLYTIFGLVNIYALFTYSQNIVLSRCDCSHSWERTFIYYYSMLVMSLYVFLATFVIIAILCCGKLNIDVKTLKNIKNNLNLKSKSKKK